MKKLTLTDFLVKVNKLDIFSSAKFALYLILLEQVQRDNDDYKENHEKLSLNVFAKQNEHHLKQKSKFVEWKSHRTKLGIKIKINILKQISPMSDVKRNIDVTVSDTIIDNDVNKENINMMNETKIVITVDHDSDENDNQETDYVSLYKWDKMNFFVKKKHNGIYSMYVMMEPTTTMNNHNLRPKAMSIWPSTENKEEHDFTEWCKGFGI